MYQIIFSNDLRQKPVLNQAYIVPLLPKKIWNCANCASSMPPAACYNHPKAKGNLAPGVLCCLRSDTLADLLWLLKSIENYDVIPMAKIAQAREMIGRVKE